MLSIREEVESIVARHRVALQDRIRTRKQELLSESKDHHMAFAALGVSAEDSSDIDLHQSISRLVYRHSGSMMEEVTRHCLERAYPGAGKMMIPNAVGDSPKKFEIDCLVEDKDAIEIKWRDPERVIELSHQMTFLSERSSRARLS